MDELNKNQNRSENSLAPVAENTEPSKSAGADDLLPATAGSSVVKTKQTEEPVARVESVTFDETTADDNMSGGYATVNGKNVRTRDRMLWIVLAVMIVMCIAVGVCSSLITAHFMRSGTQPPVIGTGDVQQNITAVVSGRKSCVAEVECGGVRGSGVVMKLDGETVYVLTNVHVLARNIESSREPSVRFFGEDSWYKARVIGYDSHYDIAVIGVKMNISDKRDYNILDLDGSEYFSPDVAYSEGDYVVSIGNAMGMGVAVYDGIISRKSELLECDELFGSGKKTVPVTRTTAVINAGMSGGALFDMHGNFIGLGTYRMSNSAGVGVDGDSGSDVEDTGFVTPVSVVYPVYKRIMSEANGGAVPVLDVNASIVNSSAIGWIGLPFGFNCEYSDGKLKVVALDGGTPSTQVVVGDRITEIGNIEVTDNICDAIGALLYYKRGGSGDALRLTIERDGSTVTVTVDGYRYAI